MARIERVIDQDVERVVDLDTGEVVQSKAVYHVSTVQHATDGDYIKLYIKTIAAFKQLGAGESNLLFALAEMMPYSGRLDAEGHPIGQMIYINSAMKKDLAKSLNLSVNSVNAYLSRLCKSGLLVRRDVGKYQVNPNFLAKGSSEEVVALRATFDFVTGDFFTHAELREKNPE